MNTHSSLGVHTIFQPNGIGRNVKNVLENRFYNFQFDCVANIELYVLNIDSIHWLITKCNVSNTESIFRT